MPIFRPNCPAHHSQLDDALATWVLQCLTRHVAITGILIKSTSECVCLCGCIKIKANVFAD
ncbi:hypothetical protein Plhal304r1_c015g0056381 [Plasmopara halstedii]